MRFDSFVAPSNTLLSASISNENKPKKKERYPHESIGPSYQYMKTKY